MVWSKIRQIPVKNAPGYRYKPATGTIPKNPAEPQLSGLVKIHRIIAVGNREKLMDVAYIE